MTTQQNFHEFKLIVVGDSGVGKTSYLKTISVGEPYTIPNLRLDVYPVQMPTDKGPVMFNGWDIPAGDQFKSRRDEFYVGAHCAIIMFDRTNRSSFENVPNWHRDITRVCGNIAITIVGNKIDDIESCRVNDNEISALLQELDASIIDDPTDEGEAKDDYEGHDHV